MNVAEYLVRARALYANEPAICVGTQRTHTFQELFVSVSYFAAELQERGVKKGDRVLLFLENRPEFVVAMFATWWIGASIVPLNIKLHPKELAYILGHSGSVVSVVSDKTEACCNEASLISGSRAEQINVDRSSPRLSALPVDQPKFMLPTDTAWVFYTSGTTGKPKGALLSHGSIRFASMNVRSDLDAGTVGDTLFHAAPMSHGSGLCVIAYVIGGACQVIPESGGFDPDEIHRLVRAYRNCCIFAPPTLVHRLTLSREESPPNNIKTIIYGGGPMHLATLTAALERFGPRFVQLYAQGECPMTIATLPKWAHSDTAHPYYANRMTSAGLPSTGAHVRIFDRAHQPVTRGQVGEIVVQSPAMMTGYLGDPTATKEAIVDGWLKTGDIGLFDDDGFLYLKDRSKEMIISGGTNIYTKEVEDIILQHPAIAQVAVVSKIDRDWGEVPVAFVVAKNTAGLNLADLDKHCLDNLSRFKRPKHYKLVDALPINGVGKVLKRELKDLVTSDPDFRFDYAVGKEKH